MQFSQQVLIHQWHPCKLIRGAQYDRKWLYMHPNLNIQAEL